MSKLTVFIHLKWPSLKTGSGSGEKKTIRIRRNDANSSNPDPQHGGVSSNSGLQIFSVLVLVHSATVRDAGFEPRPAAAAVWSYQWCGSGRILLGSWSDLEVRIWSRIRILNKKNLIILYIKICCDKIHFVLFHSQFCVFYSEFVSYVKKYLVNILVFFYVLWLFRVGTGSGQFDRIQSRPEGSDPAGSATLDLTMNK